MNFKFLFIFGTILLFIGLFWLLVPHAFHNDISPKGLDIPHIIHIIEGSILALLGLIFMLYSEKKLKPKAKNPN